MNALVTTKRLDPARTLQPAETALTRPRSRTTIAFDARRPCAGRYRFAASGVALIGGDILYEFGSSLRPHRTLRVQREKDWHWSGFRADATLIDPLPTGDVLVIIVPDCGASSAVGDHEATSVLVSMERASRTLSLHGLDVTRCVDRDIAETDWSDIISTVREMWSRSGSGRGLDRLHLDALVHRLLALIHPGDVEPSNSSDARLVRALRHIEAHLGGPLSVAGMANVAGMSEAHFARRFRMMMGESAWSFVQRRRAEQAFEMLIRSSEGLAEIAYACGYANQAHMTTSLKQRYGRTPGSIRMTRLSQSQDLGVEAE